jgi:hypothetical protein
VTKDQREAANAERMRTFGVWLEGKIFERKRYSSHQEFARAAGLTYNSVKTLTQGGAKKPDGSFAVANPNDATLRKVAAALSLDEAEVFERVGGTFRQRNPDRWQREGDPWASGTRGTTAERLERLEAELAQMRQRAERMAAALREAGIAVPNGEADQQAKPSRRQRSPG